MKTHPVGAELFHADRRTDGQTGVTKLVVAFHSFANAPKIHFFCMYSSLSTSIYAIHCSVLV